jgi:hypothetical protein
MLFVVKMSRVRIEYKWTSNINPVQLFSLQKNVYFYTRSGIPCNMLQVMHARTKIRRIYLVELLYTLLQARYALAQA